MSESTTDDRTTRSRETEVDRIDTGAMKYLSGIASLVGLWILASPFVFEATEAALWNDVVVGAAIFLLAGYNYYRMSKAMLANVGVASLVALLGLWALISPFVFEMGSEALTWSTIVSGLIVAALSAYNAYANRKADARARTGARA